MQNIEYSRGIKEYCLNGDESKVIRFSATDFNMADRLKRALVEIESIGKSYEQTNTKALDSDALTNLMSEMDEKIRGQIDYIFNSNISSIVFGKTNCLSLSHGSPIFQNFLNAIVPIVEKDLNAEIKASEKNISKYTSQVKRK